MMTPLPNSTDLFAQINALHDKEIDLGLDRFKKLLKRLGKPHKSLPPTIHVAGTNGKGSTIAFLEAFFISMGYIVHRFSSPHLQSIHECISLDGEPIEETLLCELLEEIIHANKDAPLTHFEALTAAAFLAFSRTKGHILLLETGMGGLGDTTNVLKDPIATILTPISLDHKEFLGDTIAEIATQKAGILKKDTPVIVSQQSPEAQAVILEQVRTLDIPCYLQGRDWFVKKAGDKMVFEGWTGDRAFPRPALIGDHQIQNAGAALACLQALGGRYDFPDEALSNAMLDVEWPARLEHFRPVPKFLDGFQVWLDGGHNEAAALTIAEQIKKWSDQPVYVVTGLMARKDHDAFLKAFAGQVDHVYCTPISDQPCHSANDLAQSVQALQGNATACEDLQLALDLIAAERKGPAHILVCGSLYLIGEFYDLFRQPE